MGAELLAEIDSGVLDTKGDGPRENEGKNNTENCRKLARKGHRSALGFIVCPLLVDGGQLAGAS